MTIMHCLRITAAALMLSTAACSGSSGSGGGASAADNTLSGIVSAGPVNGSTVRVYALSSDGSQGALLATSITDSSGRYSLTLEAQAGPVVIVANGGSYTEEASSVTVSLGQAVLRTALTSTSGGQKVGVTPVTEIAVQNTLAAAANNGSVSLSTLISQSNQMVGTAMGLGDITLPPSNPSIPAAQASSPAAAQYAVVLAAISQMAKTASQNAGSQVNSLDLTQALATSFLYNRSFVATVSSAGSPVNIPVPNAGGTPLTLATVLGAAAGGATFDTAMAASAATAAAAMGYATSAVPAITFNSAPPIPAGAPTLALPAAPPTLPATRPSVSGPPSPPPPFLVRDTPPTGTQSSLRGVKVDTAGNVYAIGYRAPANFSSSALLLTKYSSSGQKLWEIPAPSGTASSNNLAIDADGNIILAGVGRGVNGEVAGGASPELFISKYSPAGTHVWTKEDTASQNTYVNGLALDSAGNIVVVGSTTGTTMDGIARTGVSDLFISKYTAAGVRSWTKLYGAAGLSVNPSRFAIDKSDNLVVGGVASNAANTNGLDGRTQIGGYDFFLKKTDSAGNYVWTAQGGGPTANSAAQVQAIAFDSTGAVYIGIVAQRAVIDGVPMINNLDSYFSKYTAAGVRVFTINDGVAEGGGVSVQDMTIDSNDRIYMTGNTQSPIGGQPRYSAPNQGDLYVSRYTTSGERIWASIPGASVMNNVTTGSSGGLAMTMSPTGTVVVVGQSTKTISSSLISNYILMGFSPAGLHQ